MRWIFLMNIDIELQKDGLKVTALLVFFSLLYLLMPFFSLFIYIIWPIPIVYLIMKYDIKEAFIVIVIAALLNTLILSITINTTLGVFMGMYSIVGFGLIGFFLGSGLKEGFAPLKTLIITIVAVFISNLLVFIIQSSFPGLGIQQLLQEFTNIVDQSQLPSEFSLLMEQYINIISILYPALILITSIIQGSLTYYATFWYLKRKGIYAQAYKPVKNWAFPRWGLSIAILLTMLSRMVWKYGGTTTGAQEIYNIISLNLLVILSFLLFLQGFAVAIYYLSRIKSKILYIVFIFIVLIFYYVIALIGLIDLWFNLRRDQG